MVSLSLDEIPADIPITLISQYESCDPAFLLNEQDMGPGYQAKLLNSVNLFDRKVIATEVHTFGWKSKLWENSGLELF